MRQILLMVGCALLASESVKAFDAAPPPKVKTLAWTMKVATECRVGPLELRNAVASGVVKFLGASDGSLAGFYLTLDVKEVADRVGRRVTTVEKEGMTWIEVVGRLGDQLDADVVISPGRVKLVARKVEEKKEKE